MADRSFGHLTQSAYTLRPRRSSISNFARWVTACLACLALGVVVAIGYTRQQHLPCAPCTAGQQQDDSVRLELTRTRLALEQEMAARAAVQEAADASATEARRLSEELRFLRSQAQPPRR